MMRLLSLALAPGLAAASCPNSCSGHGTCGSDDTCTCYQDWVMGDQEGGDCSDRKCPTGRLCFEGYTGKGCGIQTCPNDCSGHGACTYAEDAPFGTVWGDYYTAKSNSLTGLGTDRSRTWRSSPRASGRRHHLQPSGEVCNGGFGDSTNGGWYGKYESNNWARGATSIAGFNGQNSDNWDPDCFKDFLNKSFALTFTSKMNQSYTTKPLVLNETNVFNISKAFSGDVRKALYLLEVETDECLDGCTPKLENPSRSSRTRANITGGVIGGNTQKMGTAPFLQYKGNVTSMPDIFSFVKEQVTADYNSYECGRRGKCDYSTGECECFEGYMGDRCQMQTALI
ncbi:hypothetical protein JL721_2881 [Aureococcus anophagefferens]|nr:hypothetical protein JL721_2881 [Aureococcus anophagefferens]